MNERPTSNMRKLRPPVIKAAQSLDDKDSYEAVALFDGMRYDGSLISAGTRLPKVSMAGEEIRFMKA